MTIKRLPILLSLLAFSVIVMVALASSPQSGVILSASIPREYSVPKWQCDVICKCSAPSMMSEIFYEVIGTTSGQEVVCALTDPTPNSSNPGNYGIRNSSNCNTECQVAYPNRNDVRGASIVSSRQACHRIGECLVPTLIKSSSQQIRPAENPSLPISLSSS